MGIQNMDKAKLFKLFGFVSTTQDLNTRGIGLGLSITKKIISKFGGEIGFKSEWKKGSTFGFMIELENQLKDQVIDSIVRPDADESEEEPQPPVADEPAEKPATSRRADPLPTQRDEYADTEVLDSDADPNQIDLEQIHEMPFNILAHLPKR